MAVESETPERWTQWLEVLFQHIVELHDHRAIWNELVDMVQANREIPDPWFFLDWVGRLWASTMVVGIRRLDDRDPKSVSLARLIADVGKHPELASRKHHRSRHAETYPGDDWMQRRADEEYDDYVGSGLPLAEMVQRDLDKLRAAGAAIRHHVNKYVAHTDEHAGPPTATYADIDAALDGVTALYRRYSSLITGSAPSAMTPTHQFDWTQPFLVAWKPDGDYLEALRRQGQVPRADPRDPG